MIIIVGFKQDGCSEFQHKKHHQWFDNTILQNSKLKNKSFLIVDTPHKRVVADTPTVTGSCSSKKSDPIDIPLKI